MKCRKAKPSAWQIQLIISSSSKLDVQKTEPSRNSTWYLHPFFRNSAWNHTLLEHKPEHGRKILHSPKESIQKCAIATQNFDDRLMTRAQITGTIASVRRHRLQQDDIDGELNGRVHGSSSRHSHNGQHHVSFVAFDCLMRIMR